MRCCCARGWRAGPTARQAFTPGALDRGSAPARRLSQEPRRQKSRIINELQAQEESAMDALDYTSAVEGSDTYAKRCAFWIAQSAPKFSRRIREREQRPLILTGHGLSLRVNKGNFLVRDGSTHLPQTQADWRFFNGGLDIPPAFIVIDGSGDITMDAIDWLARHRVPLMRIRWDGQFSSIVTSGGQAANADKIHWQQKTRENPRERLAFATNIIRQKAANTLATMESLPRSPLWDRTCKNIATRAELLERKPPRTFAHLLGIEGSIAGEYFRVWSGLSIKWKPLKRYPIP